jgi:hypothetical protein
VTAIGAERKLVLEVTCFPLSPKLPFRNPLGPSEEGGIRSLANSGQIAGTLGADQRYQRSGKPIAKVTIPP